MSVKQYATHSFELFGFSEKLFLGKTGKFSKTAKAHIFFDTAVDHLFRKTDFNVLYDCTAFCAVT